MEKHTDNTIPDESTLSKNYKSNIFKSVMNQIISDIENNTILTIIVDETKGFFFFFH